MSNWPAFASCYGVGIAPEFDPKGKYLRIVAKQGQGPGEFEGLFNFTILKDGSGLGFQKFDGPYASLKYFDRKMGFVVAKTPRGHGLILESAVISPLGTLFGSFYVTPDRPSNTMKYRTAILDTDFKVLKEISSGSGPLPDRSRFSGPGYWSQRIGNNLKRYFQGSGVFNFDAGGHVFCAPINEYAPRTFTLPIRIIAPMSEK